MSECFLDSIRSVYPTSLSTSILRFQQPIRSNEEAQGSFECEVCGKRFKTKTNFKMHSAVHSDRRDFKCTICEKSFKRNGDLKIHLRCHENKREFECKICGKFFNTKSHLNTHYRRIHQTAKNFKCHQCEKSFKTSGDLKSHSMTHSQIKNFECPECGKLFKTNYELRGHLVIHSDKKDFKCEICNREFKRLRCLKSHKLTHSNKKTFYVALWLRLWFCVNYYTVAWNPRYIKYVDHIEDIQRRFLKYMSLKFNIHPESTYDERCSSFGLKSLKTIQNENDLLFLFKSLNSLVDSRMFVEKFVRATSRDTRNSRTFAPPTASTNLGLNSPFYRMMSSFDFIIWIWAVKI